MTASQTIVEVLRRSEQGATRPFVCKADDGRVYYVKGRDAGRRSLCCEWVAGHLALGMDLPVPPFLIVDVPSAVLKQSTRADIRDLGTGLAFASLAVENAREISRVEAEACDPDLRARILLFDWWVYNEDRSLVEATGNPNLLVTRDNGQTGVWVVDFNLALDPEFSTEGFWRDHIFAPMVPAWPEGFRDAVAPRLETGVEQLEALFDSLPAEWQYLDADETVEPVLSEREVRAMLVRALEQPEEFWRRQ